MKYKKRLIYRPSASIAYTHSPVRAFPHLSSPPPTSFPQAHRSHSPLPPSRTASAPRFRPLAPRLGTLSQSPSLSFPNSSRHPSVSSSSAPSPAPSSFVDAETARTYQASRAPPPFPFPAPRIRDRERDR
ncbi:hypothetical protein BC938DRAFT_472817 [Jimgerdemannia flammicorona]|uniref:Uncharacterized protein n=1 Tax=Jimgerdemannia flammicorona TaxID=994334 RepID=A0A433Q5B6_9FUNG|nr:hypothetical protein BC938DRAFT_472817 [Jimgerdemannia flammicorona]